MPTGFSMAKVNSSWYTSNDDKWATPQAFFDVVDSEFGFSLDVCALEDSAKCELYFDPEDDALSQDWGFHRCWMNPPYGKPIASFMAKAVEAARKGALVVALVPMRTDTAWWHDYVMPWADEVRAVKGRLKFGDASNSAPFPSALVVYRHYTLRNVAGLKFMSYDWRQLAQKNGA